MIDKTKVSEVGLKRYYAHEKDGRIIKVVNLNGKEVSREKLDKRLMFPVGAGIANLGIKKFKREHPDATAAEIKQFKEGTWQYPPAQMHIEATALAPVKEKKHASK